MRKCLLFAVKRPLYPHARRVCFGAGRPAADGGLDRLQTQLRARLYGAEQTVRLWSRFVHARLKGARLFDQRQHLQFLATERVLQFCLADARVNVAVPRKQEGFVKIGAYIES